jgi:hypothetical protein
VLLVSLLQHSTIPLVDTKEATPINTELAICEQVCPDSCVFNNVFDDESDMSDLSKTSGSGGSETTTKKEKSLGTKIQKKADNQS